MASNVRDWLEGLGLGAHAASFAANEIDLDAARELTEGDLRELGLAMGPRKKLLRAIRELSAPGDAPGPAAAASPEAERRQLTVLFCDLVGSTELSRRLDPEGLREVMGRYQDAVSEAVTHNEGHVAKFLGDGVLAYFGWPRAHEDQAERSVRAGLEAVRAVGALAADGVALAARVGIATGDVVVGELSGEAGAITGETPNLAARLQGEAGAGEVVVGAVTRHLLADVFETTRLGMRKLRGFDEPVPVWRIEAERASESRFEALRGGVSTRFVGRSSELGLLAERWALAAGGEGQVVLIAGEAGIGKSRLTESFRHGLVEDTLFRVHLQASPHHANTPLHATIRSVRHAAGFAPGDEATRRLDKLRAWLERDGATDDETPALYADLLGLPYTERWPPLDLSPQEQKRRTFDVLIRRVLTLARRRPVLLIVEDAHWADPTTLELVEAQVAAIRDAAVLMVVTHRPEWQASFRNQAHVTSLQLNRLGRAQGAEIARAAAVTDVGDDVVERIVARADGVPLFIEELAKSIVEGGPDDRAVDIPTTLQALLLARLDRLGPEAREVAQIGAAIGREFAHDLLVAVAARPEAEIEDCLARMVRAELVFQQAGAAEARYLFKHALVQDAAYESLLESRRRTLHERIAEVLAQGGESEPELLAHHYTEAGLAEEAIDGWREAGERALRRSANVEAINHLEKGLRLLADFPEAPARDRRELPLQLALGAALMAAKGQGVPEVLGAYARARLLGERLGDTGGHFRALWGSWRSHFMMAEYRPARALGEQCLQLAEASEDVALRMVAGFALGGSLLFMGEFHEARDHLERAVQLYDIERHRSLGFLYGQDPGPSNLAYQSWILWYAGLPERAIEKGREAVDLATETNHPLTLAMVTMYFAITHTLCRDWASVEAQSAIAMDQAEAHGFPQIISFASSMRGRAWVEAGQFDEGISLIERGIATRKAIDLRAARLIELALLAEAHGLAERIEDGLDVVAEALAFAAETDERFYLPELHRLEGSLRLREAKPEAAEDAFRRALAEAAGQAALSLELRAATDLARLLAEQGRGNEARDLLAPIRGRFTEGPGDEHAEDQDAKASIRPTSWRPRKY